MEKFVTNKDRVQKLTKRVVDGAQPEQYRYIVWDIEVRGFGLRVAPSGRKTFIARYRAGVGALALSVRQQSVDTAPSRQIRHACLPVER
jgi:Arm DNA-binding domain